MKSVECYVSGRVQKVLFRDFTHRLANHLGITGYVENLTDGRVHVIATGEETVIDTFLAKLEKGSLLSRVDSVTVNTIPTTEFKDFRIVYRGILDRI